MPIYQEASLKKYPWLWRYDLRRKTHSCYKRGHRLRWNQIRKKKDIILFGLCRYCDRCRFLHIAFDQFNQIKDIKKQYLITEVKPITQEEAKELMRKREIEENEPLDKQGTEEEGKFENTSE
jgi:hypothetical protein